jgi:nucleoside-diphosphate-sugar epimerase
MESLFIVLELAREGRLERVYWPSSIAVFGPTTPEGCHAATHHRGTQYGVWHQQTGR